MITVVLADDHAIFREGLRTLLSFEPDIKVLGEAGDGNGALALIREKRPDIAVVDVSMPGMDGIEVARNARNTGTGIIVLTMHKEPEKVSKALSSGVSGYILKDGVFEEVVRAIRVVNTGETYLSGSISKELEVFRQNHSGNLALSNASLHSVLVKVREWISQNLSSDFTLPDAAIANGTSVSHLSRLYKEQLGISFTDDVNRMRVERAKTLLDETDESIELIRQKVGYDTSQHFFSQFKKFTGKTPREYRLRSKSDD